MRNMMPLNTVKPANGFYYGSYVRFFAGAFYRAHFPKTVRM